MEFNAKQQKSAKNLATKQTPGTFRKPHRKAPGTRIGILMDWREASNKSGKMSGRYGRAHRDGR